MTEPSAEKQFILLRILDPIKTHPRGSHYCRHEDTGGRGASGTWNKRSCSWCCGWGSSSSGCTCSLACPCQGRTRSTWNFIMKSASACSLRLLLAKPLDKVCLSKSPMDFLLILTRLSFLLNCLWAGNTGASVTNTKIGNIIIYKKVKICKAVAILTWSYLQSEDC